MKRASIDIGSNTVQFIILNGDDLFLHKQYVTNLGYKLDETQKFHDQSMKDTLNALIDVKNILDDNNISIKNVIATATEASRVAKNGPAFYDDVLEKTEIKVEIISSEKEAFYSAKGIILGQDLNSFTAIDIGGASTELISSIANPFEIKKSISLPLGSVRMANWFNENTLNGKLADILDIDYSPYLNAKIIGVAGTMSSLYMMANNISKFSHESVNQKLLKLEEIKNVYEKIKDISAEEILNIYPFLGKRSKVIKFGASLAIEILNKLSSIELVVSSQGVVFGSIQDL